MRPFLPGWSSCLLVALATAGCGKDAGGTDPADATAPHSPEQVAHDPAAMLEDRVEALLSLLTLEEKVAQMHGDSALNSGGLNFMRDNPRLGIPGFRMVDGMRGVGAATGPATSFPVGSARGATFDLELERQVGEAIGAEARARGANVLLAPTINLVRHPRWGRAQESYGEDTFHVGSLAAVFVQGVQQHVIASAKHFAANSIEDSRFMVDVTLDERTLREVYLPHFKRAVSAGVGSIMSAYNLVNGVHCGENVHLLHDILKGEWGFDGFVVSDWLLGTTSTVPSVLAGLDIEMPDANFYGQPLLDALNTGVLPTSAVDQSVRRILRDKVRFGIIDGKPALDPALTIASPAHIALARRVETEAAVLLKNDGTLPLAARPGVRIVVLGALADRANLGDTGSSQTQSSYVVTPLAGLMANARGATITPVATDTPAPEQLAQLDGADAVVVVVGLDARNEGEGAIAAGDRRSLALSPVHEQLVNSALAHNAHTVVVLEGSGPSLVEGFVERASALLLAWYPGLEGGNALADLLFGDKSPSGRLPVSFPRAESQLPTFVNDQPHVSYGLLHGYRYLDAAGSEPRFPFGFGLGYTTFSLAALTLGPPLNGVVEARVDVSNTGARDGEHVVQLYVSYPGSRVERAPRELKAFQRVSLKRGETRSVTLSFAVADLAYWDVVTSAFVVEPLTYTVAVGSSSRDLPLSATLTL